MRQLATLTATALLLGLASSGSADNTEAEVHYLLRYVAASGCTFHRNGADHASADAADHLRLKYSRGGKYVNSAEQFIDRLASESSWSGDPYTVTCGGQAQSSGAWLHRALDDYRQQQGN